MGTLPHPTLPYLPTYLLIPQPIPHCNPTHTTKTPHLSHIQLFSLLHSHTPRFRPVHYSRYHNSLIQLSFYIQSHTSSTQHPLHCTKRFHPLTHSHAHILLHSSVPTETASQILEGVYHFHSFSVQHYVQQRRSHIHLDTHNLTFIHIYSQLSPLTHPSKFANQALQLFRRLCH